MAEVSKNLRASATLTGTAPDRVHLAGNGGQFYDVAVSNEAGAALLIVTLDGSVPSAGSDSWAVPAGMVLQLPALGAAHNDDAADVGIVGNGNTYTAQLIPVRG